MLSILIPTYNCDCTPLVTALHLQCERLSVARGLDYEIVVADDGSTDATCLSALRQMGALSHLRIIRNTENRGRSYTRNRLAREARGNRLLYIDSHMTVAHDDFVERYLDTAAGVCHGGYIVPTGLQDMDGNLRYRYELRAAHINHPSLSLPQGEGTQNLKTSKPQNLKTSNQDFHTANFCIDRDIMIAHPMDEAIRRYGYEDVLFGKRLAEDGIRVERIDNPLLFDHFETNHAFITKTQESIQTLVQMKGELKGYSRLLHIAERLRRIGLARPLAWLHSLIRGPLLRNLEGNKPSLHALDIYKLTLYFHLSK